MAAVAVATVEHASLPSLISQAARALAGATTAAEVLDARDKATLAYDAAKRAARIQKAKRAHDDIIAATHRAQADALEIEAAAKRRLADEYDSAQARGEVAKRGGERSGREHSPAAPSAGEIGLDRKQIHDARQVRDAIATNPAVVREALDDILAHGDEPTRAALKRAIQPAVKSIRADIQAEKKERRQAREIELGSRQAALPAKKYGIIVADPEWRFEPYSTETGMDRAADNHYPTSDLLTIMRRDVGALAAKDCVLFLWATAPMLVEAICVLDAWGFAWVERDASTGFLSPNKAHARYVTNFCWIKQKMAGGYWNRGKHELLLVATRGNPVAPAQGDQLKSDFDGSAHAADASDHSAKPEDFMAWIDANWPNTPKIELNARRARPGWDAWGLEAPEDGENSESGDAVDAVDGRSLGRPLAARGSDKAAVEDPEAKASEDNGATVKAIEVPSDSMAGEVSRAHGPDHAGGTPPPIRRDGVERHDSDTCERAAAESGVTAGETAPLIPVDLRPSGDHATELTIGGMRKNGSGRLCFRKDGDGFSWSYDLDLYGLVGACGPFHDVAADFESCLESALRFARQTLAGWAEREDSVTTDKHRAAARGGAKWCGDKLAEFGLGEATA